MTRPTLTRALAAVLAAALSAPLARAADAPKAGSTEKAPGKALARRNRSRDEPSVRYIGFDGYCDVTAAAEPAK